MANPAPSPSKREGPAWESGLKDTRAVLFDVDGTLYDQGVLRRRMMRELLGLPIRTRSVRGTRSVYRLIRAYRHVLEELRQETTPNAALAAVHLSMAAERSGCSEDLANAVITEWMTERPLRHLAKAKPKGLDEMLRDLTTSNVKVGFFSDYPLVRKLKTLGLADMGCVHLDAQDSTVGVYKPHTKGFLRAATLMGVSPASVLYVGDRPAIDGRGALAAGMSFLRVSGRSLGSFSPLRDLISRTQ